MKVSEKLKQRALNDVSFSFEYFCPKTDQGLFNLVSRIDQMAKLEPLFVDITWNAGGSSSADTTLELIEVCEREIQVDTCMHMTCAGMSEEEVDKALKSAFDAGCRTVLALRGDPPQVRDEDCHKSDFVSKFNYAKDLVAHIKSKFGDQMSVGVAGYPEGHPEEMSQEKLIQYLKEKVDAGADFIVTQMFYDVDLFIEWHSKVRAAGITVPVIPGIMPISGWSSFLRRAKWCQINLPDKFVEELEPLKHDDAAVRQRGTELIAEMCTKLIKNTDVDHLHFYTMNLEKSCVMCLDAMNLSKRSESAVEEGEPVNDLRSTTRRKSNLSSVKPIHWRNRPSSYSSRTATWDEFPNGRWGDSRSPAFNNLNELDVLLRVSSVSARAKWGYPTSAKDIGVIVSKYLKGELDSLPWSDTPAAAEAQAISNELNFINSGTLNWFSINSQPAVNGVPSNDLKFGWGPKNGYVYQKAYIELLVDPALWDKIKTKLALIDPSEATYYAVGSQKDSPLVTNATKEEVNAITWGIFPGKEVVQPTIVEGDSFLAWKDEAFRIAFEWSRCYVCNSDTQHFLTTLAREWVLVNIVHHDFHNQNGLFDLLRAITD